VVSISTLPSDVKGTIAISSLFITQSININITITILKAQTIKTGLNTSFIIFSTLITSDKNQRLSSLSILNTFNNIITGINGIIIHNIKTLNKLNKNIKNIIKVKEINIIAESHKSKNKSHQSVILLLLSIDHECFWISLKLNTDKPKNIKGPDIESYAGISVSITQFKSSSLISAKVDSGSGSN